MAQVPRTPASLLWEHQLKREHGHLQLRMEEVEASNRGYDARIRSIEAGISAAKDAAKNIDDLDRRITAIQDDEKMQRIQREQSTHKITTIEKDLEQCQKMQQGVSALDALYKDTATALGSYVKDIEAIQTTLMRQQQQISCIPGIEHIRELTLRLNTLESRDTQQLKDVIMLQKKLVNYKIQNTELLSEVSRLQSVIAILPEKREAPFPPPSNVPIHSAMEALGPSTRASLDSATKVPSLLPMVKASGPSISQATTEDSPSPVIARLLAPVSPLPEGRGDYSIARLEEISPAQNVQQRRTVKFGIPPQPLQQQSGNRKVDINGSIQHDTASSQEVGKNGKSQRTGSSYRRGLRDRNTMGKLQSSLVIQSQELELTRKSRATTSAIHKVSSRATQRSTKPSAPKKPPACVSCRTRKIKCRHNRNDILQSNEHSSEKQVLEKRPTDPSYQTATMDSSRKKRGRNILPDYANHGDYLAAIENNKITS